MAKKQAAKEAASAREIPADVIGAVVLADLAQIEADGETHPDEFAKARILKAARRLREIAQGNASVVEVECAEAALV